MTAVASSGAMPRTDSSTQWLCVAVMLSMCLRLCIYSRWWPTVHMYDHSHNLTPWLVWGSWSGLVLMLAVVVACPCHCPDSSRGHGPYSLARAAWPDNKLSLHFFSSPLLNVPYPVFHLPLFRPPPLNWTEWFAVLCFSLPVIFLDEFLKYVSRQTVMFNKEFVH